ncbi:choice-of-anchor M domain-containing protein [Actinoplanes couchii]
MLATVVAGTAVVLAPASSATAAEGPAPQPREHRIIAGVHTDAVSTFLDDGKLTLASKADVDEGNGTRFASGDIWFHLADDAQATVPAGYEFIAPAGSQVWIAPESNPGSGRLWPGFSTESIPAGAIENNQTTLTLTGVDGPGNLELFTAAGFGGAKRLWSSSQDLKTFSVGRTHMHANWAFTAAGTYRLGVEAAVVMGGQRQTARATYTFVVGDMPTAAATTTALTASATSVVAGDRVRLDATVDASGFVEFLDGTTVLGHTEVTAGRATFETTTLPLGRRELTARFVPHVLNDFTRSVSAPVVVTVTEKPGGEVFAITGLADRYQAGQIIDLGITGATAGDGDTWRWLVRPAGLTSDYLALRGDRYTRDATVAMHGSQIKVQLRSADGKTLQETGYHPITVDGPNVGTGEPVTVTGMRDSYHLGDPVRVTVTHRPLAAGETGRWANRLVPIGAVWNPASEWSQPKPVPGVPTDHFLDTSWINQYEWAYEIVGPDGVVVGRSAAHSAAITNRELLLSGIRTVYRVGDTLRAESELYPARDGVTYQWSLTDPIPGATSSSLELPVTADLDGQTLFLTTTDADTGYTIGWAQQKLRVTDAAPGEQQVFLDSLSGHYHQGNTIRLSAAADPVAGDTDTYRWWWKRPDQGDFVAIDEATAAVHEVRAEQALDGTLVKADLLSAAGDVLATSEPATIHVDDHGAAPQQKVAIEQTGDRVTATVNPASVLTRWEWHVQRQGAETASPVAGQREASLQLSAADDGATVFARLTFDDGRKYVESAPLQVVAPPPGGDAAKTVTATISEAEGALVMSVAVADRSVILPAAVLNGTGDRWESTGTLRPVTITDTRTEKPGWTASGQIPNGFRTEKGQSFPGSHLTWTPKVVAQGDTQGVTTGPIADLGTSAALATSAPGSGRGTAQLDAGLTLSVPTDTEPGVYTGTLTLTAL